MEGGRRRVSGGEGEGTPEKDVYAPERGHHQSLFLLILAFSGSKTGLISLSIPPTVERGEIRAVEARGVRAPNSEKKS